MKYFILAFGLVFFLKPAGAQISCKQILDGQGVNSKITMALIEAKTKQNEDKEIHGMVARTFQLDQNKMKNMSSALIDLLNSEPALSAEKGPYELIVDSVLTQREALQDLTLRNLFVKKGDLSSQTVASPTGVFSSMTLSQ